MAQLTLAPVAEVIARRILVALRWWQILQVQEAKNAQRLNRIQIWGEKEEQKTVPAEETGAPKYHN